MSISTVASRYAKSLIDLAKEKNVVDSVYNDMVLFKQVAEANRNFRLTLASPLVRHDKKLSILNTIFKGKVDDLSLSIFHIITRKHREAILHNIAEEFIKQYDQYRGIQKALVVSSTPLTEALRSEFVNLIAKDTGKTIDLEEKVDPALIGGFILRVGDRQIDSTVKSKLNALKLQLLN